MKKTFTFLTLSMFLCFGTLKAQLAAGDIAPDFTITDVYGVEHSLYDKLDEGKFVILDMFATWCVPCWNYHTSGVLEDFMHDYGPDGTDQVYVYSVEVDNSTPEQWIFGPPGNTVGDWTLGGTLNYPIMNAPTNTNNDFNINFYPTVYGVCPTTRQIYEVGQASAAVLATWIESCSLEGSVINETDVLCFDDENGSAEGISTGGYGDVTYTWSDGTTGETNDGLAVGDYNLRIREQNGHFVTLDFSIGGPDSEVTMELTDMAAPMCNGDGMGSLSVEADGGVGNFSYEWSNGMSGPTINNLAGGDYTVTIKDANLCQTEATFTIEEPEVLELDPIAVPANCGQSDGSLIIIAVGGTEPYTYDIGNGPTSQTDHVDLPAGEYAVYIVDANDCWTETFVTIDDEPAPLADAGDEKAITCDLPTATLEGNSDNDGSNIQFLWTTTDGNIVSGEATLNPVVNAPGTYQLEVWNTDNNCISMDMVAVTGTVDLPDVDAGEAAQFACNTESLTLSGSTNSGNSITWSTANGNIVSGGDSSNPTVDAPGTYQLTVTNPTTGCSNIDQVIIEDTRITPSGEYTSMKQALTIDVTATVNDANANYTWDMGDGTTLSGAIANHTYATEGDYNVCLNFENGCGANQVCNVQSVNAGFSLDIEVKNVSCFGGSDGSINITPLNNEGDVTYVWNTGDTGTGINELGVGAYTLVAVDGAGTEIERMFNITSPDQIVQTGVSVGNTTNGLDNGLIEIIVEGGVAPYAYNWSNGVSTDVNMIENLPASTYTVIVKDANECEITFGPFEVQASTDLNEINNLKAFDVFPNPADDFVKVNLEFDNVIDGQISLINAYGQRINMENINGDLITKNLDLRNLSVGIYMVLIETQEGTAVKKILKQ